MFTRCEDMNGDKNIEIVVDWGFGVTQDWVTDRQTDRQTDIRWWHILC